MSITNQAGFRASFQLDPETPPRAAELFQLALTTEPAKTAEELMEKIELEDFQYLRAEGGGLSAVVKASRNGGEFHWGHRPLLAVYHFPFRDLPEEWQAPFLDFWGRYGAAVAGIRAHDLGGDTIGV